MDSSVQHTVLLRVTNDHGYAAIACILPLHLSPSAPSHPHTPGLSLHYHLYTQHETSSLDSGFGLSCSIANFSIRFVRYSATAGLVESVAANFS